jgi:hypothetical protein
MRICKIFDLNTPRKTSRETHIPIPSSIASKLSRGSPPQTLYEGVEEPEGTETAPPASQQHKHHHPTASGRHSSSKLPVKSRQQQSTTRDFHQRPLTEHKGGGGEDSGVSLAEDSAAGAVISTHTAQLGSGKTVKKRDACCSPVRHLSNSDNNITNIVQASPSTSLGIGAKAGGQVGTAMPSHARHSGLRAHTHRFATAIRRHTIGITSQGHHSTAIGVGGAKTSTSSAPGLSKSGGGRKIVGRFSSDSDADNGEDMFVANRRKRANSGEYDGEPEPSDTDPGR